MNVYIIEEYSFSYGEYFFWSVKSRVEFFEWLSLNSYRGLSSFDTYGFANIYEDVELSEEKWTGFRVSVHVINVDETQIS